MSAFLTVDFFFPCNNRNLALNAAYKKSLKLLRLIAWLFPKQKSSKEQEKFSFNATYCVLILPENKL